MYLVLFLSFYVFLVMIFTVLSNISLSRDITVFCFVDPLDDIMVTFNFHLVALGLGSLVNESKHSPMTS